jgi:hypothetical protein
LPRRRVAIVETDGDGRFRPQRAQERRQFGRLILSQRFGGEEVQGARFRIGQQALQDRQVVAQRLAGSRPGDDGDVVTGQGRFDGGRLVGVERRQVARPQRRRQRRIEIARQVGVMRRARRKAFPGGDLSHEIGVEAKRLEDRLDRHARDYTSRSRRLPKRAFHTRFFDAKTGMVRQASDSPWPPSSSASPSP